jgi:TPR repeat protein
MPWSIAKTCGSLLAVALVLAAGTAKAGLREEAQSAFDKGDYATALKIYRQLAERGDADAQTAIAKMYAEGRGVRFDPGEAAKWFRRASDQYNALTAYERGEYERALQFYRPLADQGQLMAQYMVGLMYANSQGVPLDYGEAMKWLRKAADQGEPKAQFNVGVLYFKGLGTARDPAEAAKWYRRAADQGEPVALYNLAAMYAKGEGVAQDIVAAHMLYSLAAARGVNAADEARTELAKSMSPPQIAEAEVRARDWTARPEQ